MMEKHRGRADQHHRPGLQERALLAATLDSVLAQTFGPTGSASSWTTVRRTRSRTSPRATSRATGASVCCGRRTRGRRRPQRRLRLREPGRRVRHLPGQRRHLGAGRAGRAGGGPGRPPRRRRGARTRRPHRAERRTAAGATRRDDAGRLGSRAALTPLRPDQPTTLDSLVTKFKMYPPGLVLMRRPLVARAGLWDGGAAWHHLGGLGHVHPRQPLRPHPLRGPGHRRLPPARDQHDRPTTTPGTRKRRQDILRRLVAQRRGVRPPRRSWCAGRRRPTGGPSAPGSGRRCSSLAPQAASRARWPPAT